MRRRGRNRTNILFSFHVLRSDEIILLLRRKYGTVRTRPALAGLRQRTVPFSLSSSFNISFPHSAILKDKRMFAL